MVVFLFSEMKDNDNAMDTFEISIKEEANVGGNDDKVPGPTLHSFSEIAISNENGEGEMFGNFETEDSA